MSPAEEKALLQQGIAAARAGDKPAARARFRELTGKNFDNELAWLWLASVADTPAHAMACLRRVLQINEGNDKARAALFRLLMEKGIEAARANDKSSAYALFQEASTLDAASELVWTWLASTAPAPPQALAALRRVLQLNAAHDQAARAFKKLIVQQSIELAQAGDAGARDLLTEATTVDPENDTLWLWLARSVPSSEAIPLYERVLQINPAHDAARAALRQLRPEPVAAPPDEADEPLFDEPSAPDLESELDSDFDTALEAADLDEELGGGSGGGYANGHANGYVGPLNGAATASLTANGNGHGHGLGNGSGTNAAAHGNGHGHGNGNGHAHAHGAGGYDVSDSHDLDSYGGASVTGLGQKPSHTIDLSQLNLEDDPAPVAAIPAAPQGELVIYHGADTSAVLGSHQASPAATLEASAPVQYETNADYGGVAYASGSAYTTDDTAFTTSSDYGAGPAGAGAALLDSQGGYEADVDSYVAASEQAYADSVAQLHAGGAVIAVESSSSALLGTQEFEITRNGDYGDYDDAQAFVPTAGTGAVDDADAAIELVDAGMIVSDAQAAEPAVADVADDDALESFASEADTAAPVAVAEPEPEAVVVPAPSAGGGAMLGSILGVSQIVPAPSPVTNGQSAWDCPICLSGAPEGAVRCPNCGSVVSLDDPDLLMQTDDVDRRHVLQVVARLKNRAAGSDQFDHQFTLGLAYINANRMTEGLGHLRMASQLRPRDQRLKGQIDALERRAAQGARRTKASSPSPFASPAPSSSAPTISPVPAAFKPSSPAPAVELPAPSASHEASEGGVGDAPLHAAEHASVASSTGANDGRRVILVVDDSPTIQKVVSVTLEAHGHEVVTASDGMEALSKLRTLRPDLVLLDITMPHMDGYQLCRILRSNDLTRQVPIVMLSGKDGLFDKMRGRMAGAATYITKPFAPSALPPLVDKYCKRVG